MPAVRVLVVDDSALARNVSRAVLSVSREIEVVGTARDGLDALERIAELAPDVVTLDLMMPSLDGVGVMRALNARPRRPAVVIVSMADDDSELGVTALALGAFDVVKKSTALATDRLYEVGEELRAKVLEAARARPMAVGPVAATVEPAVPVGNTGLVVIGTSTGGPQALSRIFRALPADFPVPISVVLHMPAGYTEAFAERLDKECALEIMEAREGLAMIPGRVIVGRAGLHLSLGPADAQSHWTSLLTTAPSGSLHRPSVDVLFASAALHVGNRVLGVVMTGMGNDGTEGARAIRRAGGRVFTEAESSCVVYGMPRSVVEAGLSNGSAPIDELAALIMRNL